MTGELKGYALYAEGSGFVRVFVNTMGTPLHYTFTQDMNECRLWPKIGDAMRASVELFAVTGIHFKVETVYVTD